MMLTLNDGRSELWQWDTKRKLTVDADCSQVHFSNKVFGRSNDVDVIDGIAIIPDILLQTDKDLTAWAFVGTAENGYTKISKTFKVNKRNKPADYVFTPTEQTSLEEIKEKLDYLESIQDPDAIKNAVDDYLANNPIMVKETDPTVPEWAKQPTPPDVKIPDKLPNPHSITFTGAVDASYDGSNPVEIKIPDSGGNVDHSGGLSDTAKTLLITILRNAIYGTDQSANITLLESVLSSGGGSSGGDTTVQYSITNNLTNITNSNTAVTVTENGMYIATLTANDGYEIDSVTVTMGGVDVTASVYSGGAVTIASVTGNIVITASAVEAAPESAYIQDGLLHEFTDLTTARTITGGQSIFNSENDFTVFASCAKLSAPVVGNSSSKNEFCLWFNWNGSIQAQVWVTDNSYWPSITYNPSDGSDGVMEHVCVVKSGNTYTMHVYEGEGSYSSNSQAMSSGGKHYIQDGDLVINHSNKEIDKILIYNRALSEEEISKNFMVIKLEVGA